jgi:transcription elongation GreA/GreB family factor
MISYRTKMGEALMGAKVGDSIELPETGKAVLKNVAPLPEKMRAALAGDK